MSNNDMTVATENLPAEIAADLDAELANINSKVGGGGGNRIKTSGKKFKFPDKPDDKLAGPIPLVILGWISENLYYGGKVYDESNPEPPVCWALGENPKELVPGEGSTDRQAKSCGTCPMNEWESGVGKAKACKNTRKLAVVRPDATEEDDIFFLSVSPKALKNYDGYVKKLASKKALPIMVITEVSFEEDSSFPALQFKAVEPNVLAEQHWARRQEALEALLVEPDPSDFTPRENAGRAPTAAKEGGRSAGSRKV